MQGNFIRYSLILFALAMPSATGVYLANKQRLTLDQQEVESTPIDNKPGEEIKDAPIPSKAEPFEAPLTESMA